MIPTQTSAIRTWLHVHHHPDSYTKRPERSDAHRRSNQNNPNIKITKYHRLDDQANPTTEERKQHEPRGRILSTFFIKAVLSSRCLSIPSSAPHSPHGKQTRPPTQVMAPITPKRSKCNDCQFKLEPQAIHQFHWFRQSSETSVIVALRVAAAFTCYKCRRTSTHQLATAPKPS